MNIGGGEAADQMVRMLLSGTEVVIRLSGSALKNLLALTLALARNHKKLSGKVNLGKMLRETRDLRQFSMTPEQYKEFQHRARKQKLLFATVRDRDGWGKLIDVILPVTELDRANQIFQRMLYQEPDRQPEAPTPERERTKERTSPEKGPQERQRHPKTPTARQDPQTPTQGRQSGQTAPHQADPPKKESRSGRGSRDTRTSSSTPQGQGGTAQGLPGAVGAELRPGQRENKIQAQDEIMACLKQAFHSSGVRRPMNGAPRIFCVFPEVNATETAIPSKQASCLPALLHPRGMGGAAHRPITGKQPGPGWRTAGPDRQPDRRAPESPGGAVDGQESPLHPELHRRLYHGPRPVGRGARPQA